MVQVLVALVDALRQGTLNPAQQEATRQLRAGLLALAEATNMDDVKVPTPAQFVNGRQ